MPRSTMCSIQPSISCAVGTSPGFTRRSNQKRRVAGVRCARHPLVDAGDLRAVRLGGRALALVVRLAVVVDLQHVLAVVARALVREVGPRDLERVLAVELLLRA